MKAYYTNLGVDIFTDAVSLPGVALRPGPEAYDMLKAAVVTAVHRTISYIPQKIFTWFVKEVANVRRKGDAEAAKALLAEIHKLIGNAIYGKFIEAVERQTKVLYTTDEDEVDKHLRSAFFEDLKEIGDEYKIESRKTKVTINRPFQEGIVVYQLAKLRMLQFYYDFLDKYIDRRDFELIQMDTDSMYFALSYDTLDEAVKRELTQHFENNKKQWLSWDKWSNREPGLFKLEKEGTRAIALCSKCYFVEGEKSGKAKMSSKGRTSHKGRTSCNGVDTSKPWRGTRTWPQTGASG